MTSHYAVFGNPISHSKSPLIHAAFARQTGQDMDYQAILAPLGDFAGSVAEFRAQGGAGANVTVPFKEQAFQLATRHTDRALAAGAVNTLKFENDGTLLGDNTDGAGLVRDIESNLGIPLRDTRVLLIGAGGAAAGVLQPILDREPAMVVVTNRTPEKAARLVARAIHGRTAVTACAFDQLRHEFDVVINATSASLSGKVPALPPGLFALDSLAYDMMYSQDDTTFMTWARGQGATQVSDGLGMLVEQAAESFYLWRRVHPHTAPVIQMLRSVR